MSFDFFDWILDTYMVDPEMAFEQCLLFGVDPEDFMGRLDQVFGLS